MGAEKSTPVMCHVVEKLTLYASDSLFIEVPAAVGWYIVNRDYEILELVESFWAEPQRRMVFCDVPYQVIFRVEERDADGPTKGRTEP